ncbi:MAG: hypothetical protein ACYCZY_01540 [Lacisediminihabitans sp.]
MNFFAWFAAVAPVPDPNFNPDTVTPTWIGFGVTFLVAAATVLLILDMTRRIRRVRYRGEIREQLEAEREAADIGGSSDPATTTAAPTTAEATKAEATKAKPAPED